MLKYSFSLPLPQNYGSYYTYDIWCDYIYIYLTNMIYVTKMFNILVTYFNIIYLLYNPVCFVLCTKKHFSKKESISSSGLPKEPMEHMRQTLVL